MSIHMKNKVLTILSLMIFILLSCTEKENKENLPTTQEPIVPGEGKYEVGAPICVREGMVRFYIEMREGGVAAEFSPNNLSEGWTLHVGNRTYPIQTEEGYVFADVDDVPSGKYSAYLVKDGSPFWDGESGYVNLILPYAQFSQSIEETIELLPRYAEYKEETGNRLIFGASASLLKVKIKGDAKIASIKVENKAQDGYLAGVGYYAPSTERFAVESGKDFVVLNTTQNGRYVTVQKSGYTEFPVLISSGVYPEGLELSVCDSRHLLTTEHISLKSISADEIREFEMEWGPKLDLLFYDGFDTFVWGGDIMSGNGSYGARPDMTGKVETSLTGYEQVLSPVDYNTKGTGVIQPEIWNEVSGSTVGKVHTMSSSYVESRNIADYELLYRVQEFPGYIGIGTVNEYGGYFKAPITSRIGSLSDVKVSFDCCPSATFAGNICLKIVHGGRVRSIAVDGVVVELEKVKSGYNGSTYSGTLASDAIAIPMSAAESKKWHKVDVVVENANTATEVLLTTYETNGTSKNGFYIDNFEVRSLGNVQKGTLRVLHWNIQNGMWADQHNNYDNFVKWVRLYDPDVCVWCESETIFANKTMDRLPTASRYLPSNWSKLAARYGHSYTAQSGDRDNYSQIITSKYPIEVLKKITDTDVSGKPISHGAGLFSVTVGGKAVTFLTVHMWPQTYAYGVSADDQETSAAAKGGDSYRQFEMKWLCENIYKSTTYSSRKDWIVLGDMNSYSPLDNHFYGLAETDTKFLCQKEIQDNTDLIETLGTKYPGEFYSSVMGDGARVDMVYVSPSMYSKLSNVQILIDNWCKLEKCSYVTEWVGLPSDHKPYLLDFKY